MHPEHLLQQTQRVRFLVEVQPDSEESKLLIPQRQQTMVSVWGQAADMAQKLKSEN